MPFVYFLESLSDNTWYTGIALDIPKRLSEHNKGKNRFTKGHKPWKVIYHEEHKSWMEARTRKKYLKTAAGKHWLKKELIRSAGSLPD